MTTDMQAGTIDVADATCFRRTMSRFPTFVTVISAATPTGPVGCTATSVMSLSLNPPTLLVSLRSAGRTLQDVLAAGEFAVNVLSWRQRALCRRFATGDPGRRFDGVPYSVRGAVPVLDDASATVVCGVEEAFPVLDHTLLTGTVRLTGSRADTPLVLLDGADHAVAAPQQNHHVSDLGKVTL